MEQIKSTVVQIYRRLAKLHLTERVEYYASVMNVSPTVVKFSGAKTRWAVVRRAAWLAFLHSIDFAGCPVPNHTKRYLLKAKRNMETEQYDKSHFPDSFDYESAEQAWAVVEKQWHLLKRIRCSAMK